MTLANKSAGIQRIKTALIFGEYNLPTQPYLKIWSDSLLNSDHLLVRSYSARNTNGNLVESLGNITSKQKLKRLIKLSFKHPRLAQIWILNNRIESARTRISRFSRFGPLLSFRPDIVHLVNSYLYPTFTPILEKIGCRSIVTFRGYDIVVRPWNDENWRRTLQQLFSQVDSLHFVSDYLKKEAIKLGAPLEKCIVIYPSTSSAIFQSRKLSKSLENQPIKLVSTGRLTWQKGLTQGILAIRSLLDLGEDVEYQIAGDGSEKEHLNHMIQELGLTGKVHLMGHCSQEEVYQALENADIYFQPSESEALGVAIIEAAFMGKAIIASNVGGIPEVIHHEETGLLVPPYNVGEMVKSISCLIHNPQLRQSLGENAQKDARERFSVERESREWQDFYLRLMNG